MKVRVCATYDTVEWTEDQDGNSHSLEDGGFCDPRNPWGTEYTALEEDREILTFDSLGEAAEFAVDFPGAVWDIFPDCDAHQNPRTGVAKTVTLHIMDHEPAVAELTSRLNHCGPRGRYVSQLKERR